jgi:uncharacterized membrane protein HdeD (DUF308 family)
MLTTFKTLTKSVKHWYIPLIIGIIFIALGIYILTVPLETYVVLSILFSLSFIISGLFDIYFSIRNHKILQGWGWYLVGGLLLLAVGVFLIIYPNISIAVLPFVVGITLLFRSFQLLGFAFDLKSLKILNWGNTAMISLLGIVCSFMLLASPIFTGFSLVLLTGFSCIFIGISSIFLSFDLKKLKGIPDKLNSELKNKIEAIKKEIDEHFGNK